MAAKTVRRYRLPFAVLGAVLVVACLVFCRNAFAASSDDVPSSHDTQTVRVGYYESRGFLEGAADGEVKSGFGYEYMQRAASYADWRFDYVYGSWPELYDMLKRGEIDILPGVSQMKNHRSEVLFPSTSMLSETFYLYGDVTDGFAEGSGASLSPGVRIGVVEASNSESSFAVWLAEEGIDVTEVAFPSAEDMKSAFYNGSIDLFVSSDNVAHDFKGVIPVEIVGKEPYYLAVTNSRPDLLAKVNSVQDIMFSQDRAFLDELQIRYTADSSASAYLSAEEIAWADAHPSLTVGYLNDYLPYCDTDRYGKPTGLMVDVLAAALDSLPGAWYPDIEYRGFDDQQDLFDALNAGDIDVAFPVGGETWYAEANGFLRSTAVTSSSMELVLRVDDDFESASERIAVNRHNLLQQNYVKRYFPNAEIVACDSIGECLAAVKDGRAGSTVANGLRAGALLNAEPQLVSAQLPEPDSRCFGVVAGNGVLLQLLNRGLGIIGENYGSNVSYRYTSGLFTYTFADFARDNWAAISVICALIVALVALLLVRHFHKMHRANEREIEQNRRLEEALAQAERASQAKDVILGNLSHDIRTPLNGILGVMDVNASCADPATIQANMDKAKRAARQLLCLIDDLLEMSKLKSGDVEIGSEKFSLADVFSDVLEGVRSQAEELGVSIRCVASGDGADCEPDPCRALALLGTDQVIGSPTYLRQVLTNVFDNAVRYNHQGGQVRWDAHLDSVSAGQAQLVCTVTDTGEGMSEEYLARLFEPFSQAETTARSMYPGSGLGMPIAGALVELMGGTIDVESELGQGTAVRLQVPFAVARCECADHAHKGESEGIAGMRILLAEDNDLNMEITQCVLEREGAKVTVARDGEQALRAFEQSPLWTIDAVVMDLMMPVMDGCAATRAIRSLARIDAQEVPIIAMTANVFEDDRKRALDAGMNEHLTKPVDPARLIAVLSKYRPRIQ